MRIKRTLPPAAAPIEVQDLISGLRGMLRGGETLSKFEKELKEYFEAEYCFAVSSGKAALTLVLEVLHQLRPEQNEVVIPAYTCYSVPSAVIRARLAIRLCDIEETTLDFDLNQLSRQLKSKKVLCVMPTHLFGVPANIRKLRELVGEKPIFIVEDAAQAMGAEWQGGKLGALGDVGFFSMGRGKAFSTTEGGVIVTRDERIGQALQEKIRTLPAMRATGIVRTIGETIVLSVFMHPPLFWLPKALPFLKLGQTFYNPDFPIHRLSSFNAGTAARWQAKIERFRKLRCRNITALIESGILPPGPVGPQCPDLIRFPLITDMPERKRELLYHAERQGLGFSPGYPDSVAAIPELADQHFPPESFRVAKDVAARLLTLPIHPLVNDQDLQKIIGSVCPPLPLFNLSP
ncbi:DegT/DnrJ/EryC1/StrS family aminotransferase [Geomesophilobacter sediminis]|uniref:DegT/DnrJ/EryC1/StrS family aminotransferase n=1 Tax=Geomesophilobacter sediminis TaxID=2798584 RepID=A0A8J7M1Z6_9BACT|nr:DegT/DnrJ/EryC1/StrS family aminotransferase [Geomesophilobacter sediminis]MBJ6727096.1 DegT/DnrJ/EryC1/StrS family aminotransferase [Geomesophilobacter sediminis]